MRLLCSGKVKPFLVRLLHSSKVNLVLVRLTFSGMVASFIEKFRIYLVLTVFPLMFFQIVFYANSLITVHYVVGSSSGNRSYTDFYCPRPSSLYSYDDEEITSLIHFGSAQTLREIVSSAPFSGRDRPVLPKPYSSLDML